MNTRPPVFRTRGWGVATLTLLAALALFGNLRSAAQPLPCADASSETVTLPLKTFSWTADASASAQASHLPPGNVRMVDLPSTADPRISRSHLPDYLVRLQEVQPRLLIDTIPPAPVTDLAATQGTSPGTVDLSWTAPGNDGMVGTATAYRVRYNTEPITEDNWPTSIDVPGEPLPQLASSIQAMKVHGLVPNQAYHFALKTQDETLNLSGVSNTPSTQAQGFPNTTFLPLALQGFADTPPVIPDTTLVLSDSTTQYLLSISDNGVTFTFSQSTPELMALEAGDIMVGSVAENAPHGFLRRVVSVTSSDGQVIVNTADATLEDAIDSGSLDLSGELVPDNVTSSALAQGVLLAALPEMGNRFHISLNNVILYDADGNPGTTADQVRANGSIRLEPWYDFKVKWGWFRLKELSFQTGANEEVNLRITAEVNHPSIRHERVIARFYFAPIVKSIGPVPVVIAPVLTINVGLDGSVRVGMDTEVTQQASLRAGVRYANRSWRLIREFSNRFQYNTPVLTGELDMTGYAGAQLSLRLYGIVGPYAKAHAYLRLRANFDVLWWQLHGGLDAYAGVEVTILGVTIASYEAKVIDYWLLLAGAQSSNPSYCSPCYPTLCIPPPPPDLNCGNIPYSSFPVVGCDPHRFDSDFDGIGCEP